MDAVTETMGDRPIVEDCAHAVGSRHRDRPVGSLAQASFFSFRPGKPLSVGNLGMILCRDENTFDRAQAIADSLPHYSHARRTWNALSAFGRSALYRRPWFGLVSLPVGTMVDERLDLMEKQGFSPHRASAGSLAVLSARFEKLGTMVERARRISAALRAAVPATGAKPLVEAPWAFHSYYQFAIRFPSSQVRERARERLSSQGVDSIKFYHDSPRIAERYGYEPGSCPASEAAANTVLAVPCHAHLTKTEVDCILHALLSLGDSS
jgi:dTDP-4-amino-4,6-dideoxygalactose transaminase